MKKNNNHISKMTNPWDEWFAGVVDGDGYFYINKKQEISFELTTAMHDINIVYSIKNELKGGTIKRRSGSNGIRYRVKAFLIIEKIIHKLNGKLHNPVRLRQFEQVCIILNIKLISSPSIIQIPNAYLAGLIDAEGTVIVSISKTNAITSQKPGTEGKILRLSQSRGFNQIYLKITSIYKQPLLLIQNSYNLGYISTDKKNIKNKKSNEQYNWTIKKYADFVLLYDILKNYPLKSSKMHRIRLSLKYFQYKILKYHLKDFNTIEHEIWLDFCKSWFRYSA
ncbi:MAG: LAGLIDADG family homing endonuclease [Flavobacteriaceae bacterium]